MAKNVFNDTYDANNRVNVNSFDWSHANNLTTDIGRITPVFCELVPPHSSLKINPRFGLQFMPMVFPIQTRMKARMSFYKIPLRALWKDYRDFVGNFRNDLEEPYIDFTNRQSSMLSTGSLADYLGIPTTKVGDYGTWRDISFSCTTGDSLPMLQSIANSHGLSFSQLIDFLYSGDATFSCSSDDIPEDYSIMSLLHVDSVSDKDVYLRISRADNFSEAQFDRCFSDMLKSTYIVIAKDDLSEVWSYGYLDSYLKNGVITVTKNTFPVTGSDWVMYLVTPPPFDSNTIYGNVNHSGSVTPIFKFQSTDERSSTVSDVTLETSPYYSSMARDNERQIKISAYPFRAYEAIYNAYYRDPRNNPYYIDGKVSYNDWIPTYDGGADKNEYTLHRANWESDFLTSASFTPQQGDPSRPPLVGITTYTSTTANADGTMTTSENIAIVDEDGRKYGVDFTTDEEGLKDVKYTELASGTIVKQPRSLVDLATSGIAIETLRAVNAYQKFLELNMRKNYSYRNIIEGRFDVKVRYDELLMPEFLGGFSRDIDMNSVYQQTDQNIGSEHPTYERALGSQAGIAGVRGDSNNSISVFCDEECIVMGLLTVTPLPVYSQLLPKWMTYRGLLDHYQPEFNHLGFQPITYKEVCPIQSYNAGDDLSGTFGYQRPWYEYCQKVDTCHGLMRTNLRNFLMNRTFDLKPTLSTSFLLVDPEQVNDVFSVTDVTDKIYGQVWFDCVAKLPISRVAIPRLD